jgi:hypothetical protein
MLLHIIGQLLQLLGGNSQRFRGLLTHGRDHVVVQIFDEFCGLFFQPFRGLAYGAVETG